MKSKVVRLVQRLLLGCASGSLILWAAAPVAAQETIQATPHSDVDYSALARLEASILLQSQRIEVQAAELERQRIALDEQRLELGRQLTEIAILRGNAPPSQLPAAPVSNADRTATNAGAPTPAFRLSNDDLLQIAEAPIERDAFAQLRAGQSPGYTNAAGFASAGVTLIPAAAVGPAQPVGIAPPTPARPAPQLVALPENVGVLTPAGKIAYDPSFEYANTSGNRLVFRGVEIVTGVQIGVIEASDVDRNSMIGSFAARLGVTDKLELEVRAPYIHRNDEIMTLAQRDDTITRSTELAAEDWGDVEVSARYQLTDGRDGWPVTIANLRYKSNSGIGPFDVERDEFGVARELPTGSGFWGIEPGLTFLMPSDPAVLFATVGYLYHAPDRIDRVINGVAVGEVDPGDSFNGSLGFGFAVNPNFSFSLGYRHSYIMPTKSQLGATWQESDDLHAGSVQLGLTYRFNERSTVNTSFEFGVTEDAPDARIVFRIPFGG
jgi:hypothetical protein